MPTRKVKVGGGPDPYERSKGYEKGALEAERRGDLKAAEEFWRSYVRLKGKKGSYFLASYGLYQRGRLLEKMGRWEKAAVAYERAAEMTERVGSLELVAFLLLEAARCWKVAGKDGKAFGVYEALAGKWEKRGNFFGAAEAYERAAELLRGERGFGNYRKPGEAWMKCAEEHLKRGNPLDALWALERAERYFGKVGDSESLRIVEEKKRGITSR